MLDHALKSPTALALKDSPCLTGAAVADLDDFDRLSVRMVGSAKATPHDPAVHSDVNCVAPEGANVPDCDDVAKRFVSIAGHPPGQFFIAVRTEPAGKAGSRRLYSEAGVKIREEVDVMR